jgi:hypothetical protein
MHGGTWIVKWSDAALGATVVVLLLADFLAFHDLFEPHTAKDWLILAASILAVISLAGQSASRLRATYRHG